MGATRDAEDRARSVEREEREAIAAVNAKSNPSDADGRWGKKEGGGGGGAGDSADDGFEYGVVVIMKASFGFIKCAIARRTSSSTSRRLKGARTR